MEQVFFDHLEVWDQEAGELIEQFADPASVDRDRYDLVLRRSASQVWLSTRRPQAAEVFPSSELVRLTRQKAGSRSVHYGRAPKTKKERSNSCTGARCARRRARGTPGTRQN